MQIAYSIKTNQFVLHSLPSDDIFISAEPASKTLDVPIFLIRVTMLFILPFPLMYNKGWFKNIYLSKNKSQQSGLHWPWLEIIVNRKCVRFQMIYISVVIQYRS